MSKVFISYAKEDAASARMVADALQRAEFSVWWDRHIPPGKTWDDVIGRALDAAACVIVLWSRTSIQSRWVREEAEKAASRGCLIPVLVDKVDAPFGFGGIQAADLSGWRGDEHDPEFADLLRAVSDLVQTTPDRSAADQRVSESVKPAPEPHNRGSKFLWIAGGVIAIAVTSYVASNFRRAPHPEPQVKPEPRKAGALKTNPDDGQRYVWIPPGEFQMGCSARDDRDWGAHEGPLDAVRISRGFWLGQREGTQAAYEKVMRDNPSLIKGAQHPVENVTWDQARIYCEAAGGRLPTEAEWEYAARAGSAGERYGEPDAIAWYSDNSGGQTHPVEGKQPNSWGLYDMLGNVSEWVGDWFEKDSYQKLPWPAIDPKGPPSTGARVVRGGSSGGTPSGYLRASSRFGYGGRAAAAVGVGFRCAREVIP